MGAPVQSDWMQRPPYWANRRLLVPMVISTAFVSRFRASYWEGQPLNGAASSWVSTPLQLTLVKLPRRPWARRRLWARRRVVTCSPQELLLRQQVPAVPS
ncbi:hypothetical protein [Lentzea sp. NBRC 102530]|uniref:hypothetical protein n=1 Tax=Lentzea sp. NBRC 102530 TaxID=3032201 RepID=UPI0024A1F447|nr:hypothetical protein [Lentzea sp. NBRC 102530]GLY46747.1 hypothetical protein Lesp01_04030 [Lentzea sp. NBRC 102530]